VVAAPESGGPGSERVWRWRGWLIAPRLTLTRGDLETWFAGSDVTPSLPGDASQTPTLVCWRTGPETVRVTHFPQQSWLLLCSLGVLGAGLLLLGVGRTARGLVVAVGLLVVLWLVASLFWPTLLAAIIYGSQPGLVVLVLIALGAWLIRERQRRQLVFLPSFRRGARTGS
jgi:hypothetical protein